MTRFVGWGSLEHNQLMSEGDDLGLHRGLASNPGKKGTERH